MCGGCAKNFFDKIFFLYNIVPFRWSPAYSGSSGAKEKYLANATQVVAHISFGSHPVVRAHCMPTLCCFDYQLDLPGLVARCHWAHVPTTFIGEQNCMLASRLGKHTLNAMNDSNYDGNINFDEALPVMRRFWGDAPEAYSYGEFINFCKDKHPYSKVNHLNIGMLWYLAHRHKGPRPVTTPRGN